MKSQRAFKRYHGDFGFCPKINQFKAVRVFYLSHYGNDQRAGLHGMVYTTGTVTWRISKAAREVFDTHRYDSAFINGSLHWFAKSDLGNLTCTSILKPSSLDHSRCLLLMLVGVVCGS